ncbi:MAG: hypothetical protein IT179_18125, partial [Acidobacteria bacterium]|nr:hypothetical protein [Acidobacteriota bacterium]
LTVRKDPHSAGSEADIAAQTTVLSDIRNHMNTAVDAINQVEYVRAQVQSIMRTVPEGELRRAAAELEGRLTDAEMKLIELRVTGTGQDGVRFGAKLLQKFGYLANGIASSDYRPTDQHLEAAGVLQGRLEESLSEIGALVDKDVARFNDVLRRASAGQVVTRLP